MENHLTLGTAALRKAALNEEAKIYILDNELLFNVFKKAANRYIGGDTLEETIPKVLKENKDGHKCSIEFMGENTKTEMEAVVATEEFIKIGKTIKGNEFNTSISLDLSHIGLNISPELAIDNLTRICKSAGNNEVIISAEGVNMTDSIIDIYKEASKIHNNLGITLQAYLHRSKDDFADLLCYPGRIRIVKGAFETPAGHSIPRSTELNDIYLDYIDTLLFRRHRCSIATHHDIIQQEAKKMVNLYVSHKSCYEFESLYGIQQEQLAVLKEEGYMTKVYFVYGREWYLYVCNRIAEYPMNIFTALADISQ